MQDYIIFALIAVIAIQGFMHSKERKDLYNRIMAKDLTEYKIAGKKKTNPMKKKIDEYRKTWR